MIKNNIIKKKQPTADCIVARLVPSWGSIVSLLFKTTEPYTHYYDEHGEEVPYGAIASWTDVELPPESEDERIRKHIIDIIKDNAKSKCIPCDAEIAYLEKQGEQKPNGAIVEESFNEGDGFYKLNLAYLSKEQIEKVEKLVTSWNSKEQKPVSGSSEKPNNHKEWSEEDKSFYDSIMCEVVKEGMSLTPAQVNWFKSLPERFKLQPKQEWSEEDKAFLTVAIAICNKYSHKDIADWLKSLQPQPHWKRLSEKDTLERDMCYVAVRDSELSDEEKEWAFDFLKRCEPKTHWKPSEEQMNYLCAVVDEAKRRHNISVSGYRPARILESLYNDLKKL